MALTTETLSLRTADVYCISRISERDDVCMVRYGDLTAISLTPSCHSVGHNPLRCKLIRKYNSYTMVTLNSSAIKYYSKRRIGVNCIRNKSIRTCMFIRRQVNSPKTEFKSKIQFRRYPIWNHGCLRELYYPKDKGIHSVVTTLHC